MAPRALLFAILTGLLLPRTCEAARAVVSSDVDADLASDAKELEDVNVSEYPKCTKTDESGCLECSGKWLGYSLLRNEGDRTHYTLTTSTHQKIPLVLPRQKFKGEGGSKNCFAYATHQSYQTPADSAALAEEFGPSPVRRPQDVSWENFEEAMNREKAIFLGRASEDLKTLGDLPVEEGRSYYMVAAFLTPGEEYHFWGLWNNGWYCVSSKISATVQSLGYFAKPSKQCPSFGVWTQMRTKGSKYSTEMGGFYLFPCREGC